ncbi:exonuclease domain-containing protein [Patescibacteria group bacterium]|nr:exonuclease domain-containing protein [Patescibacteria group bacterium]
MDKKSVLPDKLAFVDIETTGASLIFDQIIEIGILRVEQGKLVKTYHSLVDPGHQIPPEITLLTGISQSELEKAPTFTHIKDEVWEILKDCVFVAHNARFDYGFLKNTFRKYNLDFSAKQLCTVKLSRKLYPQYLKHNLDSLIERHQINCPNRHRALDDARVIFEFYQKIQQTFATQILQQAISSLLKQPSIPVNLEKEVIDRLPAGPGVYIFYADKVPIYVGKSLHIKERVMSHFSADLRSNKELNITQQITSVQVVQCAGELGSLIKESQLIKSFQPVYNRRSKSASKITILKIIETEQGYLSLQLVDVPEIEITDLGQIGGMFKNRRAAKDFLVSIVRQHQLCEKLLGLQKTKQECFSYQLGRCLGACLGKEKPDKYNQRFLQAINTSRVKPWPFQTPVMVTEKDYQAELEESLVFDQWSYLGSVVSDGELVNFHRETLSFNREIYQILNSYLKKPKAIKIEFIQPEMLEQLA